MHRIYTYFALAAVALAGLCSCNVMEEPEHIEKQGLHSAFLDGRIAELDDETGTKGLSLVALPDWDGTEKSHIHLYENGVEGSDPNITIDPDDSRIAHFTATFGEEEEEFPIIAPTKANATYEYTGIIAPSDKSGSFVVPAVQSPTDKAKIDPKADFLIGCTRTSQTAYSPTDPVNLTFVRPVSLFRLAIVNLPKDEKVQEIVFDTDAPLTGKFDLDDVDFENGTVNFDQTVSSNSVTLKYDNADPKTIFYAYYVICPAKAQIKSVVVKTDKATYTKEYGDDTKAVEFGNGKFYSIAVDMAGTNDDDDDTRKPQDLKFNPEEKLFEIGGEIPDFEEPELSGNETGVTYSSSDKTIASVNPVSGEVTILDKGDVVITATAAANDEFKEGEASYSITITKPAKQTPKFSQSEVSYQFGSEDFTAPKLEGVLTEVTYKSSKTEVATVDENTGVVSIVGVGETIITATAKKTPDYFGAEASYKLKVIASPDPATTKTYTKVTAFTSGKKYIIAFGKTALQNNSGSAAGYAISDDKLSGNTLTLTEADAASLEWTATSSTADTKCGNFTLSNGTSYVYRKGKDNLFTLNDGSTIEARHVWDLSTEGDAITQKNSSGQFTYYFTFSGSAWSLPQTPNKGITVYQEGEGGTPAGDEPVSTTLTFNKVNSLSAGKYLISTTDSGNPVCNFSSISGANIGEKTFTISHDAILGTEGDFAGCIVEILASSSNWLVKYNGKYLKQAGDKDPSTPTFVESKSDASVLNYSPGCLKEGSYELYHSGSKDAFMFKKNKGANNLVFYKLAD